MATLYVREVPERLYQQARKIARAQGRSLSAYVVDVLQRAIDEDKVRRGRSKALADIRRRRRPLPAKALDSVDMLRLIRGQHD